MKFEKKIYIKLENIFINQKYFYFDNITFVSIFKYFYLIF